MAGYVQIIEFQTSRIDEVREHGEQFRNQRGEGGPSRVTVTADRDRPGTYRSIVEFDSHEQAMANNDDPTTQEFAAFMAKVCDGPPTFTNLDVVTSWTG
jgi:quinol monooxygenase YgiN